LAETHRTVEPHDHNETYEDADHMDFEFDWNKHPDNIGRPLKRAPDRLAVGTNAIMFDDDGRVLLEHRSDNGFWGLPGGHVEIGEPVADAAVREVYEETGLRVRIKRMVGVYSDPANFCVIQYPDGNIAHVVTTVFECERIDGDLTLSDESTELRYFATDALPEAMLWSHRIRVEDAITPEGAPFVK
tara:strand:- start:671 stop:1231 length:561 start_codon:yes stop_codon:yes gene_type:complete